MVEERDLFSFILGQTNGARRDDIVNLFHLDAARWERFKELIIYHELAPFAYLALKDYNASLPQDVMEFLENNYYCSLLRCQELRLEFLRIARGFQRAGVILLPIKGAAFLEDIYSDRPVRPMTDMDLLVQEQDLLRAEELFCDLGYRKELWGLKEEYWRNSQSHIAFYRKEDQTLPFIELHWGLDFKRRKRSLLPEIWQRLKKVDLDGQQVQLLSPEDSLLSLALHMRRFGKTFCLKYTYDIILFLNKYGADFDWDYCLRQSRAYRICASLFFLLCQVRFLIHVDIPKYVWIQLTVPHWKRKLIQRAIEKNTFLRQKERNMKMLYLKSHFLLYDSLWEPIEYIFNIPQEQFAKFYNLAPYTRKTAFLHRYRFFYIPFKAMVRCRQP